MGGLETPRRSNGTRALVSIPLEALEPITAEAALVPVAVRWPVQLPVPADQASFYLYTDWSCAGLSSCQRRQTRHPSSMHWRASVNCTVVDPFAEPIRRICPSWSLIK